MGHPLGKDPPLSILAISKMGRRPWGTCPMCPHYNPVLRKLGYGAAGLVLDGVIEPGVEVERLVIGVVALDEQTAAQVDRETLVSPRRHHTLDDDRSPRE